mmetsp:Transcript_5436/g.13686  ORF Transcript_5436/g.13686 Transcript_5436/m.13686 type:complete len:423 (-) Transcript_5436:94-1362(-)
MSVDFESTSTRNQCLVLDHVLDRTQTISDRILDLMQCVLVGTFHQQCTRERVFDLLYESELVLTQNMLVDQTGTTQVRLAQTLQRVDCSTTTSQSETFHVSALCTTKSHNTGTSQHIQRKRVDTLLVDYHETLSVGAELLLKIDDLLTESSDTTAFTIGQHHTVFGRLVFMNRVNFTLLVFQRNIARKNVGILGTLWHTGVTTAVIENKTSNQTSVEIGLVLHEHHLDHEQVDGLVTTTNGQNSINHQLGELLSQIGAQLCEQRGTAYTIQQLLVVCINFLLALLQGSVELWTCDCEAFCNGARVKTLSNPTLCFLEDLSHQNDVAGGTITGDIVLCSGGASDEAGSRVLDLHLVQEYVAVLGQLHISAATHQHLHGSLGAQVGLQHGLQTARGADVHQQGILLPNDRSLRVQLLHCGHCFF